MTNYLKIQFIKLFDLITLIMASSVVFLVSVCVTLLLIEYFRNHPLF